MTNFVYDCHCDLVISTLASVGTNSESVFVRTPTKHDPMRAITLSLIAPTSSKFMELFLYKILSPYLNVDQVTPRWASITNDFDELVGYTYLGDVFLRNSKTGQFSILFTIGPELVPLNFYSFSEFEKSFLLHPEAVRTIFQGEKLDLIEDRLGKLANDEVYIPVPFPFLGGDRSIGSYKKGKFFTFLDLVGGLQGLEPA